MAEDKDPIFLSAAFGYTPGPVETKMHFTVHGATDIVRVWTTWSTQKERRTVLRPERVVAGLCNGVVWYVRVEGKRIRKDGTAGAPFSESYSKGWREEGLPEPGWLTAMITDAGLTFPEPTR